MTLVRTGIIWATQVSVHGHFLANLAGPVLVSGVGTAFSFIPISVAALAGVTERQSGLASGLLNTSTQIGGAIGWRSPRSWRRLGPDGLDPAVCTKHSWCAARSR
jgi:hypothetical protein